ncbi:hypothetical protein, partial [Bordetella pertussis]|uniref:hypothetical protein n=1 Tax=Bordetella pertussis TaxID=520 RepID=UPI0036719FCE
VNWGGGDFQFLKSGSDEPCIQPIESSHLVGAASRRPWSITISRAAPRRRAPCTTHPVATCRNSESPKPRN